MPRCSNKSNQNVIKKVFNVNIRILVQVQLHNIHQPEYGTPLYGWKEHNRLLNTISILQKICIDCLYYYFIIS